MDTKAIQREFQAEGFTHIYEWTDAPHTSYPKHAHKGKVSFYVLSGTIDILFEIHTSAVVAGERFDVPVGIPHTAIVGENGCKYIVAEEIEGDS